MKLVSIETIVIHHTRFNPQSFSMLNHPEHLTPLEVGRQAVHWTENPHRVGSREWFAFEDGRRDAARERGEPEDSREGLPAWA